MLWRYPFAAHRDFLYWRQTASQDIVCFQTATRTVPRLEWLLSSIRSCRTRGTERAQMLQLPTRLIPAPPSASNAMVRLTSATRPTDLSRLDLGEAGTDVAALVTSPRAEPATAALIHQPTRIMPRARAIGGSARRTYSSSLRSDSPQNALTRLGAPAERCLRHACAVRGTS
jgi:hypothetical protein